jgi:hypothetical protein
MKNVKIAALALLCLVFGSAKLPAANTVSNPDELVAQHLDSIASAQNRAALKSRAVQGPVEFKILVGGAGILDGKAVLVSEGKKFQFMMKLQNVDYRGEQFILFVQDAAIREGLWGGELSTAWPLLNLGERKAKLDFGGLKKIDGQDLYEVRYRPHKNSDLDIKLYFDPQTGHHVRTVYSYSSSSSFANLAPSSATGLQSSSGKGGGFSQGSPGVGDTAETVAARQFPNRYRLEEKFSDFKTVDGVTLPTHYDIQFSQELQNGKTTLSDWDMKGLEVLNNVSLDVHTFDVK